MSSPPPRSAFSSFLQSANTGLSKAAPPQSPADPIELVLVALGEEGLNLPAIFERTRLPVSRLMELLSQMDSMRLVAREESADGLLFRATPAGRDLAARTQS